MSVREVWKAQYARLSARIGKPKAIVAIARKLLIGIWHVLTESCPDQFIEPTQVAKSLFGHAYDIKDHLPKGQRKVDYVRQQLDQLGIGQALTHIDWGSKKPKLPPSSLVT